VAGEDAPVGLIGLGLLGTAVARRLRGIGLPVLGYDVDAARRDALAALGGRPAASIAEIARACRRIVLAVFDTGQVEEVIEGPGGLLDGGSVGALVLSMTTVDPDRLVALARRVAPHVTLIETPISGSSVQVAAGDGVGLVAGDAAAVAEIDDLLDAICPRRFLFPAVGDGGRAKLAVNLVLGLNRLALAEGLVFAEALGLDPVSFLDVLRGSAAYSQVMDVKGGKMVRRDYATEARIVQVLKDVRIVLDKAAAAGQTLPLGEVAADILQGCIDAGEGEWDNAAVIEEIRRHRTEVGR
jgi:3-hydroxyisobutyrate dehydrogenase-like beta-hydroxyacid dehydrogenase